MVSLCLVTMFKNEAHIMKEFIEHYLNQGVDKFYMIDNNSNDDSSKILKYYIDKEIVTLIVDNIPYAQAEKYNRHCLNIVKKHDWVILCDLDEFIYARKSFKTIKDVPIFYSSMVEWTFLQSYSGDFLSCLLESSDITAETQAWISGALFCGHMFE